MGIAETRDLTSGPGAGWDDTTLVGRATSGDDRAFAVLVARYQAPIFRHAWRLTQDPSSAEDITQDTFITAWQRLPTLTRLDAFRGWLYQIATHRCIDHLRCRRPQQRLVASDQTDRALVSAEPDPAAAHEQRQQLQELGAALQTLPVDQRAAWAMREIDGLSYEEIATALIVPLSTVRGRIARARRELAERMSAWQTPD
jgi:RNA polymerase sigma-70 factor (ECF subfamily)